MAGTQNVDFTSDKQGVIFDLKNQHLTSWFPYYNVNLENLFCKCNKYMYKYYGFAISSKWYTKHVHDDVLYINDILP